MNWILRDFSSLTVDELYAVLRLRSEVFVVEQECVFQDMDNKDQECFHLLGFEQNELVAYTRLVPPADINGMPSIGRVVVAHSARGNGTGRVLMEKSIEPVCDFAVSITSRTSLTPELIALSMKKRGMQCIGNDMSNGGFAGTRRSP